MIGFLCQITAYTLYTIIITNIPEPETTFSIDDRTITNLRFSDDIDGLERKDPVMTEISVSGRKLETVSQLKYLGPLSVTRDQDLTSSQEQHRQQQR